MGFYLSQIHYSTLNYLTTDNTDIPVCIPSTMSNSTIEIEKSTQVYIVNIFSFDTLHLNSSSDSFILSPSFKPALDTECFLIHLNDTETYHVNHPNPAIMEIDFTIVIFEPPQPLIIPSFPLFWFYLALVLGILYLTVSYRRKRKINKKSV